MSRFKKGDTVYYYAQGDKRMPIRARVKTVHRDNTFTVVAQFSVDPQTGEDHEFGFLGYEYRIYTDNLMSMLRGAMS